jgi:hypothetical protein
VNNKDQRLSMRFEKVIPVGVESEDFGEVGAVARNISAGGMLIETPAPLPLGSEVRVHFQIPDSQASIVARAEVKNHYAFNYCDGGEPRHARGMGVRFLEFVEDGGEVLRLSLTRFRTLH